MNRSAGRRIGGVFPVTAQEPFHLLTEQMDSFVNLLCGLPPLSAKSSTRQCPGFSSISPRNMAPGLLFSLAKIILTTPLLVLRHRTHLNDAY